MRTDSLLKTNRFREKKDAYTIIAMMKRYTLQNGKTTLVNIGSNWETYESVRKVRRSMKGRAEKVTQPHQIGSYNKEMAVLI